MHCDYRGVFNSFQYKRLGSKCIKLPFSFSSVSLTWNPLTVKFGQPGVGKMF